MDNDNQLEEIVNKCLQNEFNILPLRKFVFSFYEEETLVNANPEMQGVLTVLAPYIEFEEAFGDKDAQTKIKRLKKLLIVEKLNANNLLFILEFDRIMQLVSKLDSKKISKQVFDEQLRKLSPGAFNIAKITKWAYKHRNQDEPQYSELI